MAVSSKIEAPLNDTNNISLSERDLHALRLFRSVVDAGGLTAAERETGLERSTLSRQIKALEHSLGAAVCRRGPRGFDLTDFGRDVLVAAVALGDALEDVNQGLNRSKAVFGGKLRLGIADNCISNPESKIVEGLLAFTERAPAVEFSITIGQPENLMRELHEFRINCCILNVVSGERALVADPLFSEDFRLYVRGDVHPPLQFERLRELGIQLVLQNEPTIVPRLLRGSHLRRAVLAQGLEAIAFLVATGRFAGQLPTHYARNLETIFPLREVSGAEEASVQVQFSFVSLANRPPTRAQEYLRTLLLNTHNKVPKKQKLQAL